MKRRALLSTIGVSLVAPNTGCTTVEPTTDGTASKQEATEGTTTIWERTPSEGRQTEATPITVEYTINLSGERSGFRGIVTLDIAGSTVTKSCYGDEQGEPASRDARKQFTQRERLRTLVRASDPETWDPEHATLYCEAAVVDGSCTRMAVTIGETSYETGFGSLTEEHVPDELPALVAFLRSQLNRFEPCDPLDRERANGS